MEEVGFSRGIGNAVVFYYVAHDVSVLVHGDDFVAVGEDEDVEWFRNLVVGWFEVKVRGRLGDAVKDEKEMVILGRRMRWTSDGLELEADSGILKRLKEQFGFDEWTTAAVSTGEKEREPIDERGKLLRKKDATNFRGAAALGNYNSQDCA